MSAVKSSAQLSTKQLIELLFSSQAIRHCKTSPGLQHGFLVQVMSCQNMTDDMNVTKYTVCKKNRDRSVSELNSNSSSKL